MSPRDPRRPPALLRRLAAWLVRGPDAPFILSDLEELYARDRERGLSAGRAAARHARNMLASAASTWRRSTGGRGAVVSGLDFKLGLRMLARYPGLTAIGTLAMALGIGLGAGYLEVVHDFLHPELPFEDGDRVVGIETRDLETSSPMRRSLHDFALWRESLRTVRDVGAFRTSERNLIPSPSGRAEPIEVVEISPAAFRVARVPPLLGRTLVAADDQPGSPPVVVLGHDVWRARFAGDAGVVGRTVRVGDEERTVVGVMPQGYGFPMNQELWIPLVPSRLVEGAPAPGAGPAIRVFARLAPGATLEEAGAEVQRLGQRLAADFPDSHRHLRHRVVPYTQLFFGGGSTSRLYLVEILFVLVLVLIAANVATLVFARTATRAPEIAVRSALGASGVRIVVQLFVEALLLSLAAAAVALIVVRWLTAWLMGLVWAAFGGAPFWWDPSLAPVTIAAGVGLAFLGALVVGVLPALRAIRGATRAGLQRAAAGGDSLRLGRLWTAMLVGQVAVSVALLPAGVDLVWRWARTEADGLGFPAHQYLSARLAVAGSTPGPSFRSTLAELERRLEEEPEVEGVTFATSLPGTTHPTRAVEVEGLELSTLPEPKVGAEITDSDASTAGGPTVEVAHVAADFFEVLGASVTAGRGFRSTGEAPESRAAVVNRAFVDDVLEGRGVVGRRIRYATAPGEEAAPWGTDEAPWFEVVGVVENLATDRRGLAPGKPPALYLPLVEDAGLEDGERAVRMAIHARGEPESLTPRLREIATAVDARLRLYDPVSLDDPPALERGVRAVNELLAWAVALISLAALLVSAAGTYSLMSFTVSRRTREIGIRSALGADPRRLVLGIFARALRTLLLGVTLGVLFWLAPMAWLQASGLGEMLTGRTFGVFLVVAAALVVVGGAACGVPATRALRIEPTEALREA